MKKSLYFLIILLIVSCGKGKNSESNYEKAVMHFEKSEYFIAEKYFLKAEEQREEESLLYLLKIYDKKKDEGKIRELLNRIKEKDRLIFPVAYEYLNGSEHIEKDEKRAKELLEWGITKEDVMCYLALGNVYEYGLGVKKDFERAKSYYEKSGLNQELKNTLGENFVNFIEGLKYEMGIGIGENIEKAKEFYKKAIAEGNRDGLTRLGYLQVKENKSEKQVKIGINYLEKAWEMGDKNALITLGKIYAEGITVAKDIEKGKEYFIKGMNNEKQIGEAFGHYLDIVLFEKNTLAVDYTKIKELALEGTELGDGNSFKVLGYLYQNGYGFKKNERIAEKHYLKAIELNNLSDNRIYWYLGNLYFYGSKRVQNNEKALKNYLIAAETYDASAYEVGLIYENGYGVDIDLEKAKKYYQKARKLVPKADERYRALMSRKIKVPKEE